MTSALLMAVAALFTAFILLDDGRPATARQLPAVVQAPSRSVTLSISPSSKTIQIGDSYSIAVTASSLPWGDYISLSAPNSVAFNSACSYRSRTLYSSSSSVTVYACTAGSGTISAGLYQVEGKQQTRVATATHSVTVPPLTLPVPSDQTFPEDQAITAFTLPSATGGASPYSYSVSGLPPGLSFKESKLQVSGLPTTPGVSTVTYSVTDSATPTATTVSQTFTITITRVDPLKLPVPSDQTFPEDQAITAFTLPSATGGTPQYNYSVSGLPTGLSFTASSREVEGTPRTAGVSTVTYSVTDSGSPAATVSQTFTINITRVEPLTLPAPSNRIFPVDRTITAFTLPSATGGTPQYNYSVSGLPTGLSFNDWTLQVSGTPRTAGVSTVTYSVTDSATPAASASQAFTITIVGETPGRVATPSVVPGNTALLVSWTAPSVGRSSITEYQVQHKQTSHSSWPTTSQTSTVAAARVSGLTNGASYEVRVRACNAANACGAWSTPAGGIPQPAPTVNDANPFAGQLVTLTAPTMSAQTATSHQWQSWSNGAWANQGSASASATLSASSSSAQAWAYRVIVTYGTGATATTATSSAVLVEWSPVAIDITADNPFPVTGGDADDRTVTLTAAGDIPSGATYQWQGWSGTAWTNLGTASTTATKDVSSTTRGTKKYQVVVSYASASSPPSKTISVTSQLVHVTWDEMTIVGNLLTALRTAVSADATYTAAQTALLTCMNVGLKRDDQFQSFDDILEKFSGDTKTKMESGGTCNTQATNMFSTHRSVSQAKLATLKSGSAEYASLLETPRGLQFESQVGSSSLLKLVATVRGLEPTGTSSGGGVVGASEDEPETGFSCLPATEPSDTAAKFRVLSCLVFGTTHAFWTHQSDQLKDRIDPQTDPMDDTQGTLQWLGRGDWECTWAPEGPVPACRKHDVAYASLQKFFGIDDADERDEAWNPRNKALADAKLYADIARYGCQLQEGPLADAMCRLDTKAIAEIFHWVVSEGNDRGWPVTTHDLDHARAHKEQVVQGTNSHSFVSCDSPRRTNFSFSERGNGQFDFSWEYAPGCVSGITITSMDICWRVESNGDLLSVGCRKDLASGTESLTSAAVPSSGGAPTDVVITAYLRPIDLEYGGATYKQTWYWKASDETSES